MQIYCGSDRDAVDKCRRIITREIERLASTTLSDRAFRSIVDQYCGQILVSSDHRENLAMSLAKSILYFGRIIDITETTRQLREVTPADLREMAIKLADTPLCSLTIC